MSGCREALEALQRDGVEAWAGLPASCAPADLGDALTRLDPSPGMGDLGLRKAFFRSGVLAASGAEAQLWTSTDERAVLMVAVADPPFLASGADAVGRLGEPEARLDAARGSLPMPASEWAYPGRGLAVFADAETGAVWRATLFAPCALAEYEDLFRTPLLQRRFPAH